MKLESPGRKFVQDKIHWTEGYIKAMEDLLKQLAHLRDEPEPSISRKCWYTRITAWKQIRRIAGLRLHLARQTLSKLKEIKDDSEQATN